MEVVILFGGTRFEPEAEVVGVYATQKLAEEAARVKAAAQSPESRWLYTPKAFTVEGA